METLSDTKVKARKDHVCDYCELTIPKGQVYHRQVNKDGGEIYTWRSHLNCDEIARKLHMWENAPDKALTWEFFTENVWGYAMDKMESGQKLTWEQAMKLTWEKIKEEL